MTKRSRRTHSPAFEAKVALAAINGEKTLAELAVRIDAGPPFSALFTLWLSMTAAVGLASRPAASRHFTYRA